MINVHDDDLMVSLGIRQPKETSRDSSVWSKTLNEKKLLKAAKKKYGNL